MNRPWIEYKWGTNPFTAHPRQTDRPQSYWQHGRFAVTNSLILIWAGIIGVLHGLLPFFAPFYTADTIIRTYDKLEKSGRHDWQIQDIRGRD